MTVMTVNDEQASMIICFFFRMAIKDMFQPVYLYIFIAPPLLRCSKIRNLILIIKIIKLGIHYCARFAFINMRKKNARSICANCWNKSDKLAIAILTYTHQLLHKKLRQRDNALKFP